MGKNFWRTSPARTAGTTNSLYNLANTITQAGQLRRLNERDQALEVDRTARLARQEREDAFRRAEKVYEQDVESAFGEKPSPAFSPYTQEARSLAQPMAMATRPVLGSGMGNLVNAPSTSEDVRGAMLRGAGAARQEAAASARREMEQAASPEYKQEAQNVLQQIEQGRVVVPSTEVGKMISERMKRRGETATALKGEQELAEKRTLAPLKERKEIAETGIKETEAKYAERRTLAGLAKEEADAKYAEALNKYKLENERLGAQLKQFSVARAPLETQKLQGEIAHNQLTMQGLAESQSRAQELNNLRKQFTEAKTPEERRQFLQRMAVLGGHEGAVIADDRASQLAYANMLQRSEQLRADIVSKLGKKDPQSAQIAADAYNKEHIVVAEQAGLSRKDKVPVLAITPRSGWFGDTPTLSSSKVPLGIARLYESKELAGAAMGQVPAPQGVDPVEWAARALSWKVRIERSYPDATADSYARQITDEQAPDPVKARAVEILRSEMGMAPVTPEGAPGVPTVPGGWSQGFQENIQDVVRGLKPVQKFMEREPPKNIGVPTGSPLQFLRPKKQE